MAPRRPEGRPTGRPPADAIAPAVVPSVLPDGRLLVTADLVRTVYCEERSEWESRKAGKPVAYICPARYGGVASQRIDEELEVQKTVESVWVKTAAWFLARDIPPDSYLRLQFDRLPLKDRAPEPLQLTTGPYEAIWRENHAKFGEQVAIDLKSQRATVKVELAFLERGGLSPLQAWAGVLSQANNGLSALFRYCLARQLEGDEFDVIAELYEPTAVLEFQRYRDAYVAQWGGFLPPGFAARADRVYPMVAARRKPAV